MAASQNNLTLTINQQDASGTNILNRTIGPITYAGVAGQFTDGIFTTTGATAITFPAGLTNALQFYMKNTAATGNITVNWTPNAATGSVVAGKLVPGGMLSFWLPASGASGGITALTGTADTVNTTFELMLGG